MLNFSQLRQQLRDSELITHAAESNTRSKRAKQLMLAKTRDGA